MDFDDGVDSLEINEEQSKALLSDLKKNTPEEIRRQRRHFRVEIKETVVLQSGNASQMLDGKLRGVTGDISEGGLSAMFPLPVEVGDIFRLTFDRKKLDLPMLFARCVRCRLVRENAFECGFAFFSPIQMPASLLQRVG
jgi:c-di-GMP-binding flagellar brake protein YcgR